MSFSVTAAELLRLLETAAPPRAQLLPLVDAWAENYDRGEKLHPEDG
jgi:hypothetical protein